MKKFPRDKNLLQIRRMRAVELFESGMRASHVAKELGVSREAASTWRRIWKDVGASGLKVRDLGARRRLSDRDVVKLIDILSFPHPQTNESWNLKLITSWIYQEFGILYHQSHMTHLLKRIGVSLK